MVNCVTCQRAFKSSLGKTKNTRCESCANAFRQHELEQQKIEKEKLEKENEIRLHELSVKEKQLELEKQKITIKETLTNGSCIELTCYYDPKSHQKINELLAGARKALPTPPRQRQSLLPSETRFVHNRRKSLLENSSSSPIDNLELRRPRKLPSIDTLGKNRSLQRHKLEDDCASSAGSGMSVD